MSTEHPDFDGLSAYCDDEAPELDTHVSACEECLAEVERIRSVSEAVGGAVEPQVPRARQLALAAALDAWQPVDRDPAPEEEPDRPRPVSGRTPTTNRAGARPGIMGPADTAPEAPASLASRDRPRRMGGSGLWVGIGSVAAVLLAFVVGVNLLVDRGGGDEMTVAAGDTASTEADQATSTTAASGDAASGDAASGGTSRTGSVVDGGDLGDFADATALVDAVGSSPVAPTGSGEASGIAGKTASPAMRDSSSGDSSSGDSPSEQTTSPGLAAGVDPPPSMATGTRPCELEAREQRNQLGELVYSATARLDSVPVAVLGFRDGTDRDAPVILLALGQRGGCEIVLETVLP